MNANCFTQSHNLTLDATLTQLAAHPTVDGLALFGSFATQPTPISDYDLLVLVQGAPVAIFQMLTYIDGRMADVIFVETAQIEQWLAADHPQVAASLAGMFFQKMRKATIIYDVSNRLAQAQKQARQRAETGNLFYPTADNERYSDWFWFNHGLLHIQRMVQAHDPIYLT